MYTIVIADDDKYWLDIMDISISKDSEFIVVGKALNGKQTLELINHLKPDIIILDIIMPHYDGVYIVDYIKNRMDNYNPYIYMLTGLSTHTIINILSSMDIDYYSVKPIKVEDIVLNLKRIVNSQNNGLFEEIIYKAVDNTLIEMGASFSLVSTKQLRDAIIFYIMESDLLITRDIYPKVAISNGVNPKSVEKNIRSIIRKVSNEKSILYNTLFTQNHKVTNSEFITTLGHYVKQLLDNHN